MKVAPGTVVTIAYDITDESGEIIESSDISGPITFMAGKSGLIPGLDRRLEGMQDGQEETFEFPPEEAFGRVQDAPQKELPRDAFPADAKLEPGQQFEANMAGGHAVKLEVVKASDEGVTVRLVHPLAGQKVGMSVKILKVREATKAEKESGKAMVAPPPPPKK